MSTPPLHYLDTVLAYHEAALASVELNLVDLENDPTYALVKAASFRGATAQKVDDALRGLAEIWQQASIYRKAVTAARAQRDDLGMFPANRLPALDYTLRGPSILLTATDVPVLQRSLTGRARNQREISFEDLLAQMTATFASGRDAIAAVEAAWSGLLPRWSKLRARADRTLVQAGGLGLDHDASIVHVRSLLGNVGDHFNADPLGASQQVDALEQALAPLERRVAALSTERATIQVRLRAANDNLHTLRAAIAEGAHARQRTLELISCDPATLRYPVDASGLDRPPNGLASWLLRLVELTHEGQWDDCSAGLDHWEKMLATWERAAAEVLAVNRAPLAQRDELRGLLEAVSAKAAHVGFAEEPVLSRLAHDARGVLYQAPCDITRAAALVQDYVQRARAVRGLSAEGDRRGH
jgi:hypothetical protein